MYIIRKFVTTCGELSRTIRIRIRRYSLSFALPEQFVELGRSEGSQNDNPAYCGRLGVTVSVVEPVRLKLNVIF